MLAETVLNTLGCQRIILIPAFISPFKNGAQGASPADRLDMLAASIPADPRITLDDCEIRRQGVSYTIDTLGDIEKRYRPEGKPSLIIGDDLAGGFPQWREAHTIARRADIIIARRISAAPVPFPFPHTALNNEILELSSAEIRGRIKNQGAWRYLVPQGARLIIEDRRLYGIDGDSPPPETRFPAPPAWSLIARVEAAVQAELSPGRFLHSRNAALLARDICARFGHDPAAAYLAGIAHDICKSLPPDEQLRLIKRYDESRPPKVKKRPGAGLHGEAGAVFLRERFGVTSEAVLEAIRLHTAGASGMGPIAKAVYIADKVEPSRRDIPPELRDPARYGSLDAFFEAALEASAAYLTAKQVALAPGTVELLETARKRRAL